MKQKPATKPSITIEHDPEVEPGHHFGSEDEGSPSSTLSMLLQAIVLPVVIGFVVYALVCFSFGWIPDAPEVPYVNGVPILPRLVAFLVLLWLAGHLIDLALNLAARTLIACAKIIDVVRSIGKPRLIMGGVLALVAFVAASPALVALFDMPEARGSQNATAKKPQQPAFTRAATARSASPAPSAPPTPRLVPVAVLTPTEGSVAPLLRHLRRLHLANKPAPAMRRRRR